MSLSAHDNQHSTATDQILDSLIKHEGGICVSLFLPIANQPPESDKNVIRLRGLLENAADKLEAEGMTKDAAQDLLSPLQSYLEKPQDLLRSGDSLAFFRNSQEFHLQDLPYPVDASVAVGNRYHLRPLLELYNMNEPYLALCLNRGQISVYEGDRLALRKVDIPDMPESLEDVTGIDDPEKSLQHHSAKTVSADGRPGTGVAPQMHGQGLPDDLEDSQLDRFFREVAKRVDHYLSGKSAALLVFGVEENLGRFQSVHNWSGRQLLTSDTDPAQWSVDDVREASWELIRPHCEEKKAEIVGGFEEAKNKGELLEGVENVALAAATSRNRVAGIASDENLYGICDIDNMEVREVLEGDATCAHDLLDYIASETLKHGGQVISIPREQLPGNQVAVALTRY